MLHEFSKKVVFYVTYNLLFGHQLTEVNHEEEMETIYELFTIYDRNAVLLVDRIPIRLLPETKAARMKIINILKQMDWTRRLKVSKVIRGIIQECNGNNGIYLNFSSYKTIF